MEYALHWAMPIWLAELKNRVHTAQQRAPLAINRELAPLYWQIGWEF
ncbi:hypothetical protein [Desulfobulbus sp.]|nr:hypothetical protein [Desulfobulbus sp.]